tara:strand:- start:76 stop:393 length:318 start_codon:yes stop_codon:yes gene_type:complete
MAIRPKKPKKKKNPFRLSSDRQPGIAKANEKKPKKRTRFGGPQNPLGPRQIPKYMEPQPYRPKRTPKKGIEDFLKKLEEQRKKDPVRKLTPAQIERLKKLQKSFL